MKGLVISRFLGMLVLLTSCETVVEIDIPDEDSKLVVNCLFAPGEPFFFAISASKGILEEGVIEVVKNAAIVIKGSDGSSETLVRIESDSLKGEGYSSTLTAKRGVSYSIVASAPGYQSVSAAANIPAAIAIHKVDTATVASSGYEEGQVSVSFRDPASAKNYYELKFFLLSYMPTFDTLDSTISFIPYETEVYAYAPSDGILNAGTTQLIFDDELFNGQLYTSKLNYPKQGGFGPDTGFSEVELPMSLIAELRSLNQDCYVYQTTLSKYQISSFDPFAQPVHVYSNIENGYGIFAGYNYDRDTVRLNNATFPEF